MVSDLFDDEVIAFLRRARTNVLADVPVDEVEEAFAKLSRIRACLSTQNY